MARKILKKVVQGSIFGEEEIKLIKTKPMQYDDYIRGARDMLFQIINTMAWGESKNIRHLPRRYMKAMIERILKEPESLDKILCGERFRFREVIDHRGKKRVICEEKKHLANNISEEC